MRVLLLNPPGSRNYIRDYFCSKISKAYYKSAPAALLMLSGILAEQHEVSALDAIAETLNPEQTLEACRKLAPEVIVVLVGEVSWEEDKAFLRLLKAETHALLMGLGDVLLEDTTRRLAEAQNLDAALLHFAAPDILTWLSRPGGQPIPNVVYRHPKTRKWVAGRRVKARGAHQIPVPRHGLFPLAKYRFPFALRAPMSVVLTDYGCPFQCAFCVMPSLGFAVRPLAEVVEELRHLRTLGVREVFFIDQTFGVRRERALALCAELSKPDLKFSWSCFSRPDVTTPELLSAMARAGCHTVIYGLESGHAGLLKQQRKHYLPDQAQAALAACRRLGMRTAATFILGLPGETEVSVQETLRWALTLPLDFASFNVAVPRAGTPLRKTAATRNRALIKQALDQSGYRGAMDLPGLSGARILALRREALRRFYLRPGYWLHRLLDLRSWVDLRNQMADGWGVVQDALGAKGRGS